MITWLGENEISWAKFADVVPPTNGATTSSIKETDLRLQRAKKQQS